MEPKNINDYLPDREVFLRDERELGQEYAAKAAEIGKVIGVIKGELPPETELVVPVAETVIQISERWKALDSNQKVKRAWGRYSGKRQVSSEETVKMADMIAAQVLPPAGEHFDMVDAAANIWHAQSFICQEHNRSEQALERGLNVMYPLMNAFAERVAESGFEYLTLDVNCRELYTKMHGEDPLGAHFADIFLAAADGQLLPHEMIVRSGLLGIELSPEERRGLEGMRRDLAKRLSGAREHGMKPLVFRGKDVGLNGYDVWLSAPAYMQKDAVMHTDVPLANFIIVKAGEGTDTWDLETVKEDNWTVIESKASVQAMLRLYADGAVDHGRIKSNEKCPLLSRALDQYEGFSDPRIYFEALLAAMAFDSMAPTTVVEREAGGSVARQLREAPAWSPKASVLSKVLLPRVRIVSRTSGPVLLRQWAELEDDDQVPEISAEDAEREEVKRFLRLHPVTPHVRRLAEGCACSPEARARYVEYCELTGYRAEPEKHQGIMELGTHTFVLPRMERGSEEFGRVRAYIATLGKGAVTREVMNIGQNRQGEHK